MKLLLCQTCGDIVAPLPKEHEVRWCLCKRHAVWWDNATLGHLRVYDTALIGEPAAYVIGLTNLFLTFPGRLDKEIIQEIIEMHDEFYLFQQQKSVAVRFRPGETADVRWANRLPGKKGLGPEGSEHGTATADAGEHR